MHPITKTNLRELMERGDLTIGFVSHLVGVNPRTVQRWLSGENSIRWSAYRAIEFYILKQEQWRNFATARNHAFDHPIPIMMKSYQVKLVCNEVTFTAKVKAKNEQEAIEMARGYWIKSSRVVEIELLDGDNL